MNACILCAIVRLAAAFAFLGLASCATLPTPTPAERAAAEQMADPVPNYVSTNLSRAEVEQVLAPVALYPNDVLAQILMAATAPDDVTAAANWSRAHPELDGDEAYRAAAAEKWEPAVTGLVAFPSIVQMMGDQIDWTRRLGEIVLAQSDSLGPAIMDLRRRAMQSGALDNAPVNVFVFDDSDDIAIGSGFDRHYYIPRCNPSLAYGTWLSADYPAADSIDWIIPYYVPCRWYLQSFVHRHVFRHYAAWHKQHGHKYPCPPRGSRTWRSSDPAKSELASRKPLPESNTPRSVIPLARSPSLANVALSGGWESPQAAPNRYAGGGMSSAARIGSVFHVSGGGFGARAVSSGGSFASAGNSASSTTHTGGSSSSGGSIGASSGGSSAGSSGSARSH